MLVFSLLMLVAIIISVIASFVIKEDLAVCVSVLVASEDETCVVDITNVLFFDGDV